MLVTRCAIILLGIALVQQVHSLCNCGGCGICGACDKNSWVDYEHGSNEYVHGHAESKAPLVVRPQPVPKPPKILPASTAPVPGPCFCKKAIVKPAVLPKPVYHCCSENCNNKCNQNCHCSSTCSSSCILGGDVCNAEEYPPIVFDPKSCNCANYGPADAVSIALAQQIAQQHCTDINTEDKLAFGFRKIPVDIPKAVVRKPNVPEELIYNVNGQILELKPVNVCCGKSLDEQAAEDLLALEEEEHTCDCCQHHGCSQINLGELGYGPAKLPSNNFVNLPSSAVDSVAKTVEGTIGSAICNTACNCLTQGCHEGCNSGFVAGKVIFKTDPKPKPICIAPSPDTTDCESEEEEHTLSSELENIGSGCSCVPCLKNVFKQSHSSCSHSSTCKKKSKLIIEKFNNLSCL